MPSAYTRTGRSWSSGGNAVFECSLWSAIRLFFSLFFFSLVINKSQFRSQTSYALFLQNVLFLKTKTKSTTWLFQSILCFSLKKMVFSLQCLFIFMILFLQLFKDFVLQVFFFMNQYGPNLVSQPDGKLKNCWDAHEIVIRLT